MPKPSNVLGKSDSAIAVMQDLPGRRSDLVLGSVAAYCGRIPVALIVLCLLALAVYVFRISWKQKNELGCLLGCACGIVLSLQSLSNLLIVTGLLPLTVSVLPLFAGGAGFLVVDYLLLGLVLSIYRYKDIRQEPLRRRKGLGESFS